MSAQFRAIGSFTIPSRRWFVIFGDVVDGVVKPGMRVALSIDHATSFAAPIRSVELVSGAAGSHAALVFAASDAREFELWKSLNVGDTLLHIPENE